MAELSHTILVPIDLHGINRGSLETLVRIARQLDRALLGLLQTLGVDESGRSKIAVIPHGHYRGAYADRITREEARARLELPPQAKVVSFVGWVRSYKGVWELYEAFTKLDEPVKFELADVPEGPAPDFALKSDSGRNLRLSEFRGEVVMINFWVEWCAYCTKMDRETFGNADVANPDGAVAFALSIDNDGEVTVAQYLSLDHPDPATLEGDPADTIDPLHVVVSTLAPQVTGTGHDEQRENDDASGTQHEVVEAREVRELRHQGRRR